MPSTDIIGWAHEESEYHPPMTDKRKALPKLLSLYAFEATARLGAVSLAAEELCLTQGAVSRQLQSLEILLGLRLFARSRNRMILTEVGTIYLADVRAALGALSDATDAVTGSRGGGGTLRLATLPTFGARWLMPRLPRFCSDHPHVTVHLITRLAPFDFSLEQLDGARPGGRHHRLRRQHRRRDGRPDPRPLRVAPGRGPGRRPVRLSGSGVQLEEHP